MNDKKFNFVLIQYSQNSLDMSEEINTYAINDFKCDGIEEFSLEEKRVDEILGERAYSGGDIPESLIDEVMTATTSAEEVIYKYFFYQENFRENASSFLEFIKDNYHQLSCHLVEKDNEDWNAEWKKFYTPIIVSDKLEVIPEWLKESRAESRAEKIYIYPGMGFGTGTHETTYLCLKLYDSISHKFNNTIRCLDFGCGSGILGIAALKTKNIKTVFCDIDKDALDNCVQNLALNFEGQNLDGNTLVIRERYKEEKFGLVFANILLHVLILEKEVILNSLDVGGYIIISGLLNPQVDAILNEYKMLEKIDVLSKGDWSAVLMQKKS